MERSDDFNNNRMRQVHWHKKIVVVAITRIFDRDMSETRNQATIVGNISN